MEKKYSLVLFENKKVRAVWHNKKWYLSVIDMVAALTGSSIPKRYWSDLKSRLEEEGFEPYDEIVQLKMIAEDGKLRTTDCVNLKNALRLVQSIPSPKAEPFKR